LNFTRAIVRPPAANFAEGLTTAGLGRPDHSRALQQHEAYCKALEQCGLTLIRLEPDTNYPDSCFVEDTALLVNVRGAGTQAILMRPGAQSRLGEIETIREVLKDLLPGQPSKRSTHPKLMAAISVKLAIIFHRSFRTHKRGWRISVVNLVRSVRLWIDDCEHKGIAGVALKWYRLSRRGRLVVIDALAEREEFMDMR
jgi:N-dimethylarginine dimethylaminohydrolase